MTDTLKSKETELQKYVHEFDPYLSNVIMDELNKRTGEEVFLDKPNLIDYLNRNCRENPEFAYRLETVLFNVFDPQKVKDESVARRIRDINLLYRLKWSHKPPLTIDTKVTGRALELVVESVLKSKLKRSKRLDYEFVDWKAFDYLILDKDRNDWTVGIQCKSALAGGFLSYQKELQKLKNLTKNFPSGKAFVMFCGATYRHKKEEIKDAFENEGWKFYHFWEGLDSYKIDDSFYEFIKMIEQLVSKK